MSPTILVVDDSDDNLALAAYILRAGGYDVLVAGNGLEGLDLAAAHRPDLILLDIRMPGMNGHEVAAALRADARLAHVAIVALTASVMVGDRERITSAGFDGYIGKPIDPKTFTDTIAFYLRPVPRSPGAATGGLA